MCQSFPTPVVLGSQIPPFFGRRFRFPMACNARALAVYVAAMLFVVHSDVAALAENWPTLTGGRPIVIAHGGFSGMYPDSSDHAYQLSVNTGVPGETALWCDVHLTKDGVPICFPSITLDNGSNIIDSFPDKSTTQLVNGEATPGYFSIDYDFNDLKSIQLKQTNVARTSWFNTLYTITRISDLIIIRDLMISGQQSLLWLNIQYPSFYDQSSRPNMTTHILNLLDNTNVSYISSPDMGFLKKIQANLNSNGTKLVFVFGNEAEKEPSMNYTYGYLLKNLKDIKTFADGILIPKNYIWPVDSDNYLLPHTNVVSDAHDLGLLVYASGFMNDAVLSYNYSYDPTAEYLNFFDNDDFSVDGILSDFSITPADTLVCFSKYSSASVEQRRETLIISKEGASGDYPGCTDLAYQKAIADGAEIIDCPVQMSKDGIPFCLGSINLMDRTTIAQSTFIHRSINNAIFSFTLTWDEIQTLTPQISNPYSKYTLVRNPKHKNDGKIVSLSDFLALANKSTSLTGVLIDIRNAAYLAEHHGIGVVDAVLSALAKAGYDKKGRQRVMIQSTNSSVLTKFKNIGQYKLVYEVDELISDVLPSTLELITKFAHAVVLNKTSVFPLNEEFFLNSSTNVVSKLKDSGLDVYVATFDNEFVSIPRDFFGDPMVEMDAYVTLAKVDGLVTSFPKTTTLYKKNKCPYFIDESYSPGFFIQRIFIKPTPEPPSQILTQSDVAEPPLPPVSEIPPPVPGGPQPAGAPMPQNGNALAAYLAILLLSSILSYI